MDYLDEISKIIDDHRAEVLVTCAASCWCWNIEEAIRSYRVREEVTMPTIDTVTRCGWKGKWV